MLIGGSAGFIGGKLDLLVQRFVDAWMSFPGLLLLTIMSIAGQGLLQVIVILGVSSGIANSRVVRGAVIGIKENDYFQAAQAIGERTSGTLLWHVLPNIMAPIIVILAAQISGSLRRPRFPIACSELPFISGQRGRRQTDEQRDARPVDQAAQVVPPELVGAQGILGRRALQPVGQRHLIRIMPREGTGEDADQDQRQQHNAPERTQGLLLRCAYSPL